MANTQQNIVAVFDDFDTARQAQDDLVQSGFSRQDVQIAANDQPLVRSASSSSEYSSAPYHEGGISGFFHRIFGSDQDSDTGHYAEAVRRGSAVLTVTADDARMDAATAILNRHNPVDIDQKVGFYKERGYTGYDPDAETYSAEAAGREREEFRKTAGDRTIPVVQEELQVGKRAVQRGGVRVYSRLTETPVEEKITLREEHARVDRRAVNRPATEADFRTGGQVVEVIETDEEAVVGKSARVVEEVVVGKQSSNRSETVRDTVRRTDVEVERISPDVEQDFQRDSTARYGSESGAEYSTYGPAYEYGYRMGNDPLYKGKDWNDVENTFQSDYTKSNPGSAWDKVSAAVRTGWDKVTGKR